MVLVQLECPTVHSKIFCSPGNVLNAHQSPNKVIRIDQCFYRGKDYILREALSSIAFFQITSNILSGVN